MLNGCFKKFLGTLHTILYKIKWTDFQVKLNLHIYKTVKDFKTSFLPYFAAANVCTMKKTRGLYHVPESRYFKFSPGRFFGHCGYTYRAGCMCCSCPLDLRQMMMSQIYVLLMSSGPETDGDELDVCAAHVLWP